MPVIIVKARQGVLRDKQMKARLIEEMAATFARVVGHEEFQHRATVLIEELPDDNWGREGKQVGS
ncbi:MAG: 4-oxalocrotonate tautomerase family protein [Desulfarculaceae bacterium]|nr:4-oxalocrotonate tautomerase family protein [Desulfarculaceae bacterium]